MKIKEDLKRRNYCKVKKMKLFKPIIDNYGKLI